MHRLNTILLIEDDRVTRRTLRPKLEKKFLILEAASAQRSIDIFTQYATDIILMDLNLPDHCGFGLISKIRELTTAPLIILSSEKDELKKIKCFELGADDFVDKPCQPELLIARISAHIRRYKEISDFTHNNNQSTSEQSAMRFNGWVLDPTKFQLFDKNHKSAELSTREFNLLKYLIKNANRAIPREELCEAVREKNYIPTPRALDVKIARIRKKIGDTETHHTQQIIKTIRGVGYMFNKSENLENSE